MVTPASDSARNWYNLTLLLQTKDLTSLQVNAEGRFVRKPASHFFLRLFQESRPDADFKAAVADVVRLVDQCGQPQFDASSIITTEKVRELFFEKLPKLRASQFDYDVLRGRTEVQYMLDARTKAVQELYRKAGIASIMLRMQRGYERNKKGSSGSYIVRDFEGRRMGIFKPDKKYHALWARILRWVKRRLGLQVSHLSQRDDAEANAELAAHCLDCMFNLNVTAPSVLLRDQDFRGNFQLWRRGMQQLAEVEPRISQRRVFTNLELILFQKVMLLAFLIGDLDGHTGNILVKLRNEQIIDILKIDNANSFPAYNPTSERWSDLHQYEFARMRLAQFPFKPEVLQCIRTLLAIGDDRIVEFLQFVVPHFLSRRMERLFRQRLQAVRVLFQQQEAFGPIHLANLKTDAQFADLLGL